MRRPPQCAMCSCFPRPIQRSPAANGKSCTKLGTEVKGIKWVSMPDLVARIGELLEIEIPDLLLGAWKKCDELQSALEETRKSPALKIHVGMAEHTIVSEHTPYIEMRLAKMPAQKIPFKLKLTFKLKACELLVQGGLIKQARPGACEIEGTLSQGLLARAGEESWDRSSYPVRFPRTRAWQHPRRCRPADFAMAVKRYRVNMQ